MKESVMILKAIAFVVVLLIVAIFALLHPRDNADIFSAIIVILLACLLVILFIVKIRNHNIK